MNCLLDTSPYIWLIDNDARLSEKAKSVIEDNENKLYLSAVSFWEIVLNVAVIEKIRMNQTNPKLI